MNTFSKGAVWAAMWLPFLLGGAALRAQTTGLPAPMSGDCTTSATGVVVCTKTNGIALAPSATTDATNAANITTGTLPLAQVPVLTGAKLPAGPAGTAPTFNAAGVQTAGVAAPFAGAAGPIKVAPYAVSAQSSAGAATLGPSAGDTSFRYANVTNGARLLTGGNVTQVKSFVNLLTNVTALYFEVWRVNASGTFALAGRSANLLSATTAGQANVWTLPTPMAVRAGDYAGLYVEGSFSSAVNVFSGSTAYSTAVYPSYSVRNQGQTSTVDFLGSGTSAVAGAVGQENPIEVYLQQGPVVACIGDSKMQGMPFSGDYLQSANVGGTFTFPVAAQLNYSMATTGTSLIDHSNQPCAYISRALGYTAANLGVTGSTSTQQVSQVLPTALALKPAVLVVSGTINDPALGVSASTSLSNYQSIYTQAIAGGVQRVVMTGIEPATSIADATWTTAESVNSQLKAFCQAQTSCVWVGDTVGATLGQYRSTGVAGNLRNIQPAYAAADNLHFNNAGAQLMGLIEANGIENPAIAGTAVAVTQPAGGTRVRQVQPVSADGTLGWKWQDSRDYLQMEQQTADNAGLTPGTGNYGQQSVGCVMFAAGKGYVRCDGSLQWNVQTHTLGVNGSLAMAITDATNTSANISTMTSAAPNGAAGITGLQASGSHTWNIAAFGTGLGGYGGTLGIFDQTLGKFDMQVLNDGTWCLYGGLGACLNSPVVFSPGGNSLTVPVLAAKHLIGVSNGTLAVAAGAAASSCTVSGTDTAFLLTCTTGSSPAAGALATVSFGGAFFSAPHFASPGATNAASAAAASGIYAATTTTGLTLSTANALAASTSYAWHFVLVQ